MAIWARSVLYGLISLTVSFLFNACQSTEEAAQERLYQRNARGEYVTRASQEHAYPLPQPILTPRNAYPWE
jgi:hypothetical protein